MNGKRILVHAGFAKTGTTTLQVLLAANRVALASHGVHYPENRVTSLPARDSHPGLPFAHMVRLPANRQGVDQAECRTWLGEVLAAYRDSPHQLLILSHETMAEAAGNMDWRSMRKTLDGFDVSLLAYVRVMDDYLESRLEQVTRSGDYPLADLRRLAARLKPTRQSFLGRLKAMRDGLRATVVVRSFDAAQREDQLVEDFERHAGLPGGLLQPGPGLDGEPRRNVSMLPEHRLFLAHVAGAGLPEVIGLELRRVLRGLRQASAAPPSHRRFGLLPPRTRRRARELFNREVPRINREFGSDIEPAPSLSNSELEYATHLAREEFDRIADSLENLMDPVWLERVRRAYQQ